jgi:hypothetical protein
MTAGDSHRFEIVVGADRADADDLPSALSAAETLRREHGDRLGLQGSRLARVAIFDDGRLCRTISEGTKIRG